MKDGLDDTKQYQISGICQTHRDIAEKWSEQLEEEQEYYKNQMENALENLTVFEELYSSEILTIWVQQYFIFVFALFLYSIREKFEQHY